jgi:predicted nucleic acid-binding Zn finger protein
MNKLDDLVEICRNKDYILKITFHKCVGWTVRVHKNGRNTPITYIIGDDRDIVFDKVYKEITKDMLT